MKFGLRTTYVVAEDDEIGTRLDKWLTEQLQEDDVDVSRNTVQLWIKEGKIRSSTTKKLKASDVIESGVAYDIEIPPDEVFEIAPDPMDLAIAFEDDDVVIVDKPRGVVVHPGPGHPRGTVVNALVARGTVLSQLGGEMRPGVVHRIDKDTSGLIMFAKTDKAYYGLTEQLRAHAVERTYLAMVHGRMEHLSGTIDMPIGRDPQDRQRMAATERGKRAVTHFQAVDRFDRYSILECRLETGRTHQIRVHMLAISHPIAGDPVYGRRHTLPIDGQALHAKSLGFIHPVSHDTLQFTSETPADMQRLMTLLSTGRID